MGRPAYERVWPGRTLRKGFIGQYRFSVRQMSSNGRPESSDYGRRVTHSSNAWPYEVLERGLPGPLTKRRKNRGGRAKSPVDMSSSIRLFFCPSHQPFVPWKKTALSVKSSKGKSQPIFYIRMSLWLYLKTFVPMPRFIFSLSQGSTFAASMI